MSIEAVNIGVENVISQLDNAASRSRLLVYTISSNPRTYKLSHVSLTWNTLSHDVKEHLVKSGNYFTNKYRCLASIQSILKKI